MATNQPKQDEQFIYDGQTVFVAGQDASKVPAQVSASGYYAGVNTSVSSGVLQPRWGLDKKSLIFPEGGITNFISNLFISYDELFHSGRFQSMFPYTIGSDNYIGFVISGIIFLVNQNNLVVNIMPIQDGSSLNENTPRLNWSPAGNYTVIFDYPNFPVILDGIVARRADPALMEVPVSVGGAYNQNRLFVYNAGNEYTAGDPTGDSATPEAPVTFEEIDTVGSPVFGEIFALPTGKTENITAMAFLQLIDTSTGIGPLLIGSENAIYSVHAEIPRTVVDPLGNIIPNWEQNGFATTFVLNAGIAGFRSWVNVNSDLFFASPDGQVRTANMSRQEQGQWARVPISKEVQNWLILRDKSLATYTVMNYFNNKIFISANPYRTTAFSTSREAVFDIAFGGFVVLSLDNIATLGNTGAPAWDGLWTGIRPMDTCVTNKRFFVISKDEEFRNEFYEFLPDQTYDTDGSNIRYVDSVMYTREFSFTNIYQYGSGPFQDKDLHSMDLDLRDVQGDFKLDIKYKPSQGSQFVDWRTFTHCAPWRDCMFPTNDEINGLAGHNFMGLNIGSPNSDACDPVTNTPYSVFRKIQLKLIIEGKFWELQGLRINAVFRPQSMQIDLACDAGDCIKLAKECTITDWSIPPFKSCLTQTT